MAALGGQREAERGAKQAAAAVSWARGRSWALGVFALALGLRVGFILIFDQPLLYTHQYNYFTHALRIAQHPDPWRYIVYSDEWRTWDVHWTIAPLYFVFAGGVLRLADGHLFPLQLVQCAFDACVAVLVAGLGRRLAGPRGVWAGVAYACHWTAIELPSWTMTENLHTLLLMAGATLVTRAPAEDEPDGRRALRFLGLAGLVLGLSALTRSVTSAFLLLLAAAQPVRHGWRVGLPRALALAVGGALVILPWSARNYFITGERVPIESTAYENMLWANQLGTRDDYRAALREIARQPTSQAKRELAMQIALEGVRRHPDRFVAKVWSNFWHFVRPEGLDGLLRVERTVEPYGHLKSLLGDDLLLVVTLPLFTVFLLAARRSPERDVIVLWSAYYLLMVIVVFHNEVRYRSALTPFALAGAAGGAALLADAAARRALRARLGLLLGLAIVAASLWPYVAPARRGLATRAALRAAALHIARGELTGAEAVVAQAARDAPRSAWPFTLLARELLQAGHEPEAASAYEAARERATPVHLAPTVALPRLLAAAGQPAQARLALRAADALSWNQDPWIALELAWRELPAPRADTLLLGAGSADYGAVRGFLHPRGDDPRLARGRMWNDYARLGSAELPPPGAHRWSRARAWLRLRPVTAAARYDVTLWMGSPFPSPLVSPTVTVSVGASVARFTLGRSVAAYTLRAAAPEPGAALLVKLETPTWTRIGEPAEQGVRVERLSLTPAP